MPPPIAGGVTRAAALTPIDDHGAPPLSLGRQAFRRERCLPAQRTPRASHGYRFFSLPHRSHIRYTVQGYYLNLLEKEGLG